MYALALAAQCDRGFIKVCKKVAKTLLSVRWAAKNEKTFLVVNGYRLKKY
jgi:hypothetical protein